jgi:hypothetical protein
LQDKWDNLFVTEGYELKLLHDNNLSLDELNKAEKRILKEIDEKFKLSTYSDLIIFTHNKELFPEVEWERAEELGTSLTLSVENILKSIGKSDEAIEEIEKEITYQNKFSEMVAS